MEVKKIEKSDIEIQEQIKQLLIEAFPHSYYISAEEEVENLISKDRILLGAFEENMLLGFIGAIPQYDITGWELHPVIVKKDLKYKGIGTKLLDALEKQVAIRGGITIYLGTDDEFGKTSLSGIDLYEDMYDKIRDIRNIDKHPYEFYEKNGYKIVGVIPDANGFGKPDIIMAKRICNNDNEDR